MKNLQHTEKKDKKKEKEGALIAERGVGPNETTAK
jgi:hypothetical protein